MKLLKPQTKDFLHWVEEREAIRQNRLAGQPPPWTKDKILGTYRFCNVRRRDDRVSQWILNRILLPYAKHENLWVMAALARYVNWPDTLNMLMEAGAWPESDEPNWEKIGELLDQRCANGQQTWTGAYMIRAESNPSVPWFAYGKGPYVAQIVIGGLWEQRRVIVPQLGFTVQRAHEAFMKYGYGWGSFMAGQAVADLTYTPLLARAPDLYTWAPIGPGSKRGLNRLAGRDDILKAIPQDEANAAFIELRGLVIDKLGKEYTDLTLHDIQNCCCEVDKYLRVKTGAGRPRSLYRPQGVLS